MNTQNVSHAIYALEFVDYDENARKKCKNVIIVTTTVSERSCSPYSKSMQRTLTILCSQDLVASAVARPTSPCQCSDSSDKNGWT